MFHFPDLYAQTKGKVPDHSIKITKNFDANQRIRSLHPNPYLLWSAESP